METKTMYGKFEIWARFQSYNESVLGIRSMRFTPNQSVTGQFKHLKHLKVATCPGLQSHHRVQKQSLQAQSNQIKL